MGKYKHRIVETRKMWCAQRRGKWWPFWTTFNYTSYSMGRALECIEQDKAFWSKPRRAIYEISQ